MIRKVKFEIYNALNTNVGNICHIYEIALPLFIHIGKSGEYITISLQILFILIRVTIQKGKQTTGSIYVSKESEE